MMTRPGPFRIRLLLTCLGGLLMLAACGQKGPLYMPEPPPPPSEGMTTPPAVAPAAPIEPAPDSL